MNGFPRRRRVVVWAAFLVAGIALAGVLLVRIERARLFPAPESVSGAPPAGEGLEVVSLASPAGRAEALFLSPRDGSAAPAPLPVFFRGNAELADHWIDAFGEPRRRGWAALLVEYPGYGRSAGSPSEGALDAGLLLVLHGRRDEMIPFEHGRRLAAAVQGSEFLELSCAHNDCPREWSRVLGFLRERAGIGDEDASAGADAGT